jgi:hypothetical protein
MVAEMLWLSFMITTVTSCENMENMGSYAKFNPFSGDLKLSLFLTYNIYCYCIQKAMTFHVVVLSSEKMCKRHHVA